MKSQDKTQASKINQTCYILAISCLLLGACSETSKDAKQEENQSTKSAETKQVFKVSVVVAESTRLFDQIEIPGTVAALPDHSVKISPAIAGKLVAIDVVPGSAVAKGAVVAKLDDTHLQELLTQSQTAFNTAKVALKQAKNNLTFAEENVQRQKRLFEAEVSAKKDIVAAESQVTNAQSQVETAQSLLHTAEGTIKQNETEVAFTKVHSPIGGIVANRFLNVGDSVDPNVAIMQIVDLNNVVVNAQIAVESASSVAVGNTATIRVVYKSDEGSDATTEYHTQATITSISPIVDAQTNTIRVQLQCANANQKLKEGEQVVVTVKGKTPHTVILLPKTALVPDPEDPKKQMVYVVEDTKAHRVSVGKRALAGDKVEIVTGLKAGQKVIVKDAYGLPDDSFVETSTSSK